MILKVIGLVSAVICLQGANGATYSRVFLQNGGTDVVPIEYVNYGAPVIAESPIARLSAPRSAPVVAIPNGVPPCVSPCVVSGQNFAPVAPLPNAKFITYNAPNLPVVVAPSQDNGYEYSYVVYDENTGDKKAQREFSDGAVVRGEYSFIQPDGYVREVQYRADDLTGFNVVVKNVLPESVISIQKKLDKSDPPPCKDVKSEALKVAPEPVPTLPQTELVSAHDHGHDHDGNENHPYEDHDHDAQDGHDHSDHSHDREPVPEIAVLPSEDQTHAPVQEAPAPEPQQMAEPEPDATHAEVLEEPHVEIIVPDKPADGEPVVVVVPERPVPVVLPEIPAPVVLPEVPPPGFAISYEDIIRCIQSRTQGQQGLNLSPLTYIILPAANRPC